MLVFFLIPNYSIILADRSGYIVNARLLFALSPLNYTK